VESDLAGARETLRGLFTAGVVMPSVMEKLEADGVAAFEKSFDGLYENLEAKKSRLLERSPV
jgi:hypothetical protein